MASHDPNRPNVVFVLSDDQGPWALGAAGNHEIITPHLDRLAGEGARFTNFFCASPVCSPARASLLTGRVPSQHGVHDWIAARHVGPDSLDFLAGRPLVTDALSDAGYRCGLSGKWHLGASQQPRSGFVHWLAHQSGAGPYYGAPLVRDGRLVAEPGYVTDVFTQDATSFIDAEADRPEPFWLSLNFTAPHTPWKGNHPTDLVALYDDCPFETCPQEPDHPGVRRDSDGFPAVRGPDLRASLQGYYAAVTGLDRGVGEVLDALDRNGLAPSTLVVFGSDNGFNCGHHGIWGKGNGTYPQNMFDSSVKVPMLFRQPGRIPAGLVVDQLVSGYDLAATVLEWAGLPAGTFAGNPGRSFAPLLTGNDSEIRDHLVVFDEYGPVRMIRTREWKYVHRYRDGGPELYQLVEDPDERVNLAADAGYRHTAADLRHWLEEWFTTHAEPDHDGAHLPVSGMGQLATLEERFTRRLFEGSPTRRDE